MLIFIIKESFTSIKKAKGSFLLSLTSMSISLLLIAVSYFLIDFSDAVQNKLKKNIIINVFLNDTLSLQQSETIMILIKERKDIYSAVYINKTEAAENFIKETGEDFSKILDYNPLPASFKVVIGEDYFAPEKLKRTVKELSEIKGVDEVVYGNETAGKIYSIINESKKYIFIITLILILISIYILFTTSRFIMKLRFGEMETMKLIGAKISAIKLPVIINSALTGFTGGCISLIIFHLFISSIEGYIKHQFSYEINYLFLLSVTILAGTALGVIISTLTLRKITLKI